MRILGLNAFHGDASAALIEDGILVAAAEEERFNRTKHWAGLPVSAIRFCLNNGHAEHVAISRNPTAHMARKLARLVVHPAYWPRAVSRLRNSLSVKKTTSQLAALGLNGSTQTHFVEHHRAHLASAFFCSPFEEAAVVSIDGFGDFSSVMWGVGRGNQIEVKGSVRFPHSLGIYYTAFTQYLGFPKYGDEYKIMGLAAYGEPRFVTQVREIVSTIDDQIVLKLKYFTHHRNGIDMTWEGGEPTLGTVYSRGLCELLGKPRESHEELDQRHCDIAASVQAVLEENYFSLLSYVKRQTGLRKLCLAGGVALNCAANGGIFDRTGFRDLYIQPAAHDAGTSIGAALHVWHQTLKKPREFLMRHVYYGPEYSNAHIRKTLTDAGIRFRELSEECLIDETASAIAAGSVVGWFQGRMEFGPRALGNRSILADPRRPDMKDILNRRIKYRESFRPFCPSILAEKTGEYFEVDYPSPFMLAAYRVKEEMQSRIPAVTHGDGTGRVQTVDRDVTPLYWRLIKRFEDRTGVPVVLNTSFNENEPIVNTPGEALDCFLRTNMDVLVVGPCLVLKGENRPISGKACSLENLHV